MAKYLKKENVIRRIFVGGYELNHKVPVELTANEAKILDGEIILVKQPKKSTKKPSKNTTKETIKDTIKDTNKKSTNKE